MPTLQITLPDGTEQTHELTESLITIGRRPDNTIEIADISVSSNHAQLLGGSADYTLKDIGSTNGTTLNGAPVAADEERPLQNGDAIVFGNIECLYASEHVGAEQPMPASEGVAAVVAESSVRPADFANASPFSSKKKEKDPIGTAILVFAGVAILVFVAAAVMAFSIKSPI